MPTEEPILDGFTITGQPSAVVTPSGATGAMNQAGTGTPAARNNRLERSLSIAKALASAPRREHPGDRVHDVNLVSPAAQRLDDLRRAGERHRALRRRPPREHGDPHQWIPASWWSTS